MGVPMGVVVWGYRGGVGALRIPYKLSTFGKFRHISHNTNFGIFWCPMRMTKILCRCN